MTEPSDSIPPRLTTYWDRTQWPLQSLYFLLPMLIAYEIGTFFLAPSFETRLPPILAESLLGDFFNVFGLSGYYVPALIVVGFLIGQHLSQKKNKDSWKLEPKLYVIMLMESIALAVPLFVFMMVLFQEAPGAIHSAAAAAQTHIHQGMAAAIDAKSNGSGAVIPDWQAGIIFSLGAGIYEELLFRMIAIALIHFVLVDIFALPKKWGSAGAVVLSAVAFALYHFASQQFALGKSLFYFAAGVYFAMIYLMRGFGIAAGTHAMYDIIWVVMAYSLY